MVSIKLLLVFLALKQGSLFNAYIYTFIKFTGYLETKFHN